MSVASVASVTAVASSEADRPDPVTAVPQTDLFGDPIDTDRRTTSADRTGSAKSAHRAAMSSSDRAASNGATRLADAASPCLPVDTAPDLLHRAAQALDGLPAIHLGTSSWSFPGWRGLLYRDTYTTTALARDGLAAYAASPLLRGVGIDRSFYAPLSVAEYRGYADQVAEDFRFVVKAPASVCDALIRGAGGTPSHANPHFLDAPLAIDSFVRPCLDGLGPRAGALVFQLSPLSNAQLADPPALIRRLSDFFAALPDPGTACYALEIRDAALLTPRLIRMLREQHVRYCVGIHSRMPDIRRQIDALSMLDAEQLGPLVVRWSLHAGMRYEGARTRYEPFDAIVDPDVPTRSALAELIARYAGARQPSFIIVNNKAEGSSPISCAWLALSIADLLKRTS